VWIVLDEISGKSKDEMQKRIETTAKTPFRLLNEGQECRLECASCAADQIKSFRTAI